LREGSDGRGGIEKRNDFRPAGLARWRLEVDTTSAGSGRLIDLLGNPSRAAKLQHAVKVYIDNLRQTFDILENSSVERAGTHKKIEDLEAKYEAALARIEYLEAVLVAYADSARLQPRQPAETPRDESVTDDQARLIDPAGIQAEAAQDRIERLKENRLLREFLEQRQVPLEEVSSERRQEWRFWRRS